MKFFAACVTLAMCALATAYTASYDTVYDNGQASVSTLACSGILESEGYTTYSSLPGFPNIGGSPQITGYDSPYCGTCWILTYGSTSIVVTTVDVGDPALEGYNLSLEAMNTLTGGQAENLGRVYVDAKPC